MDAVGWVDDSSDRCLYLHGPIVAVTAMQINSESIGSKRSLEFLQSNRLQSDRYISILEQSDYKALQSAVEHVGDWVAQIAQIKFESF